MVRRRVRGSGSWSDAAAERENDPVDDEGPCTSSRTWSKVWRRSPWNGHTLVFDPQAHISHWVRLGFGSDHIRARHESEEVVRCLYDRVRADERLWTILESTGLATFAVSTMAMRESTRSTTVVQSLVEFFWDSTNTFHFPWGEMTITLADFAVISGLPITPLRVEIDDDFEGVTSYGREDVGAHYC